MDEQLRPVFSDLIGRMLVDGTLKIRQGISPKEVLTGAQTFKALETLDGSQLIEAHHQAEERIVMKPSTDDKTTARFTKSKAQSSRCPASFPRTPTWKLMAEQKRMPEKFKWLSARIERGCRSVSESTFNLP